MRFIMFAAVLSFALLARSALAEPASPHSILRAPVGLEIYDLKNPNDGWLVRQHGVRSGPLHQLTWGTRRDQRTESARIISIKRYYLRSSENPAYRIDRMKLSFNFAKTTSSDMEIRPHEKDPVIEFEFGGAVTLGTGGDLAAVDKGYDVRLSAFPPVPSGLFFRSHLLSTRLSPFPEERLKTRKLYELEGQFTESTAAFTLNGAPIASINGRSLNKGLISLITGWSPAIVKALEIEGHLEGVSGAKPLKESGLILFDRKSDTSQKGKNRGKQSRGLPSAPALTDNNELDKTLLRPVEEEIE